MKSEIDPELLRLMREWRRAEKHEATFKPGAVPGYLGQYAKTTAEALQRVRERADEIIDEHT